MKRTITILSMFVVTSGVLVGCASTASTVNPFAGRITLQVKLNTLKVDVGTPISGVAIIRNDTNKTMPWHICPQDWPAVGLVGHGATFNPATLYDLCRTKTMLKAHSSMQNPVTVATTYDACGALGTPVCPHDGIPLLPLGKYAVDIVTTGPPFSIAVLPTPKVTLVNATTGRSVGAVGGSIVIQAYGCETISYPQPPIAVTLTHGNRVIARRSKLGVTQEMFAGVSPGSYEIRSGVRPPEPVRVVDGVQAVAVVIPRCT